MMAAKTRFGSLKFKPHQNQSINIWLGLTDAQGPQERGKGVWESCLSAYVTPFKKQLKLDILQKCLLSIAVTKPLYCAYRPTELAIQVFPTIYRERQIVRGDRWCAGGDKI